ncbi:PCI-domain-containing protein [Suhomyces tanzawaensis NRRL Y-17324]|uniref:PCI-domain-containing protein n=1 Tax=Suhomyces tanzawaensis NRRL Y-17324 TaxID=984487 RepID=A0A1E4SLD7_9ASCO|nr:PCI-domain-containing protein [Suhomyces tanzawaensis NRRL Y-17324]ODV80319.1 PCI-domain-containing protein [Suhomyces tanzawaensis NRRL Y-17324]
MSREDPLKAEKDFSETLNEQFPIIDGISDHKTAIDKLLVLEKQTRQSSDVSSSKRILEKIIAILVKNDDWDYLNDLLILLSKKHGQLKSAIQTLINAVIQNLDTLKDDNKKELETKIKIIETIRTITDKKIFVEVERAIVSKKLSEIYLYQHNDLDKAVEILCDLQVETYSLMPFSDKIEFILEQIRLTLKKGDYNQAKILSRKILLKSLKNFDRADEYKAIYLKFLIEINSYENDYISIVKNMLLLIEIPLISKPETTQTKSEASSGLSLQSTHDDYLNFLTSIIYYIILSPHDPHQFDLINKIKQNSVFTKNVDLKIHDLLEVFTTNELIHWSNIESLYKVEYFNKSAIFKLETNYKNLQNRIIEHNLRTINKYYQCIRLERLAYLLQLSTSEAETYVSELVNKGMIFAKINRPQGIIKFEKAPIKAKVKFENGEEKKERTSDVHLNELLNDWCYDVDKLLEEVDSIGHLINKEEMMYGIKQGAKA